MNGPQRFDHLFDSTILGVLRDSTPLMELSTKQSNSRYENSCNSYPEFRIHVETVLWLLLARLCTHDSGVLSSHREVRMREGPLHQRILYQDELVPRAVESAALGCWRTPRPRLVSAMCLT